MCMYCTSISDYTDNTHLLCHCIVSECENIFFFMHIHIFLKHETTTTLTVLGSMILDIEGISCLEYIPSNMNYLLIIV